MQNIYSRESLYYLGISKKSMFSLCGGLFCKNRSSRLHKFIFKIYKHKYKDVEPPQLLLILIDQNEVILPIHLMHSCAEDKILAKYRLQVTQIKQNIASLAVEKYPLETLELLPKTYFRTYIFNEIFPNVQTLYLK